MIPMLRERYLAEQNARIALMLADPNKNETERFWAAMEAMHKESKTLHMCLDGLSRSQMPFKLILMRGAEMLRKEDLAGFSEELQRQVFNEFFEKRR